MSKLSQGSQRLAQRFTSEALYLAELGRIARYWVKPTPGSYDDLSEARLLPRGL
jgi:hypothetical protein